MGESDWGEEWTQYDTHSDEATNLAVLRGRISGKPVQARTSKPKKPAKLRQPKAKPQKQQPHIVDTAPIEQLQEISIPQTSTHNYALLHKALLVGTSALLIAGLGVGGTTLWQRHTLTALHRSCLSSQQANHSAFVALNSTIKTAQAASLISTSQVADAAAIQRLKQALSTKLSEPTNSCATDNRDMLQATITTLSTQTDKVNRQEQAISSAVRGVEASRALKVLQTAKSGLQAKISAAQQVLASSDGKVADNATRDTLQAAITAAQKVADDTSVKDAKQYTTAADSLQAPLQAVNDSVAKKTADDTAAAQAAQAQAQAAPTQPTAPARPQHNNVPNTNPGNTPGSAPGGGWYVPPAQNENTFPDHL